MKIADLYIRVSTDEQADKGYSQRGQEEMLRRYCSMQGIQVRKTIYEDHSAKNFERPEWKKLLFDLKKHKKQIDLILFTKWDRFSRNAGDAYAMISILRNLGVDPQAIEQPLDLLIPENKMMLAFYLAAPEVENDRRALNVIYGMRRARKEGRFVNKAPIGYVNRTTESGKKYIAIEPVQGALMNRAFEEVAQGLFNPEQIFRALQQKGLKGTRNNFWFNLRNPLYCGKIWINKFRDEDEMIVPGQHEPLITEELFNAVQDFLSGRTRCFPKKEEAPEFFLRGFLMCPQCGKKLTGSTSRGRKKYYSYYHCYRSCNYRIDNIQANKIVKKEVSKFIPFMEIGLLFAEALAYEYQQQTRDTTGAKRLLLNEIRGAEEKLRESRDWLFNGRLSPEDYSELKKELSQRIEELERKLGAIPTEPVDLKGLVEKGIRNLLKLDEAIIQQDTTRTRVIIGSIYPEKFTIVENTVRTAKVNEAVELIYRLGKGYSRLQKTKKEAKTSLLSWVDPPGLEPGTL